MKTFATVLSTVLALVATAAMIAWISGWGVNSGDTRAAQLAQAALYSALIASGLLAMTRQRLAQSLLAVAVWGVIFVLLVLAYSYRDEAQMAWGRIRSELILGEARVITPQEVEIARAADGHYYVNASLGGQKVTFIMDTGSSMVALSWDDARAIGLDPATLNYARKVMTASGPTQVAPVTITRIAVGPIERVNMPAAVLPEGVGGSLLGLTFLDTLSSYEIRGNRLTLRD